jgi:hypothetical protein
MSTLSKDQIVNRSELDSKYVDWTPVVHGSYGDISKVKLVVRLPEIYKEENVIMTVLCEVDVVQPASTNTGYKHGVYEAHTDGGLYRIIPTDSYTYRVKSDMFKTLRKTRFGFVDPNRVLYYGFGLCILVGLVALTL